ncbi:MAG: hypothetical protein HKL79_06635 [Thermoplasmata archaeon]|nr:hypothetical protein [Thermoplasmata archaeon]
MSEAVPRPSEPDPEPANSWRGPFAIFGYAVAVAGGWAVYEMLAYADLPTFTVAMLPTVTGIAIALAVFFWIGSRAPSNE